MTILKNFNINLKLDFRFEFSLVLFLLQLIGKCAYPLAIMATRSGDSSIICGKVENFRIGDSIRVRIYPRIISESKIDKFPFEEYIQTSSDGSFCFKFEAPGQYAYFALYAGVYKMNNLPVSLLQNSSNTQGIYIVENGDSISVSVKADTIQFDGKGSQKLICQYKLEKNRIREELKRFAIRFTPLVRIQGRSWTPSDGYSKFVDVHHQIYQSDSLLLTTYKKVLADQYYSMMEENVKMKFFRSILFSFYSRLQDLSLILKMDSLTKENSVYMQHELDLARQIFSSSHFRTARSYNPVSKFLTRERLSYSHYLATVQEHALLAKRKPYVQYVRNHFKVPIVDPLLANYLIVGRHFLGISTKDSIYSLITDSEIKKSLLELDDKSRIGEVAYEFSLPDVNGQLVSLKEFRGKVVLIDFWFTGCGACRKYYSEVLKDVENYFEENEDVVFIPIGVDTDSRMFSESVAKGVYTSPDRKNVRNLSTAPKGASHPLIKHYRIIGYPRPLLVGRDGKIFNYHLMQLREKNSLIRSINAALSQKGG